MIPTADARPVTLAVRWRVNAADMAAICATYEELARLTREEPGCLSFRIFVGLPPSTSFLVVESYRDETAFAAHRASPHFQRLVLGTVASRLLDVQVEMMSELEPTGGTAA